MYVGHKVSLGNMG